MDLANWPVAILAGGLATRLRPATDKTPKALLSVAGEPFLVHQLRLLHSEGFRNIVICVGYLGETVQAKIGDGNTLGLHIDYSFDGPTLLGAGGALKRALPKLTENLVVIYGDSTIAFPLLTAYAVSKAQPRPRRELFAKREELLKELKEAYLKGKEVRP